MALPVNNLAFIGIFIKIF